MVLKDLTPKKASSKNLAGFAIIIIVGGGMWYLFAMSGQSAPPPVVSEEASTTLPVATTSAISANGTKRPPVSHSLSNVATVAQDISNATIFGSLLRSTGIRASLAGKGPYTVFVPRNSAFGVLAPGTISRMTPEQKARFVQYHIIAGRIINPKAQVAGTVQAMSGDMLNFSYGPSSVPMVGSAIFIKKYQASNGVVYLIDNVLLPPQR